MFQPGYSHPMKAYHRTDASGAIMAAGFRDSVGYYMTSSRHRGVWVSDQPLDANEGASGNALVAVALPEDVFARYEWVQTPGFGYREALVPARILNRYHRRLVKEP